MELIKVYNNIIPWRGFIALTFYPWVFIREEYLRIYSAKVDRHETTHACQQVETLWILFLLIYGLEYLLKLLFCGFNHKRAYHSISFEQEAYEHEAEVYYNEVRRPYAWIKYIFTLK